MNSNTLSEPPISSTFNPAAILQPYVDAGELAGAVTLVATKDRVLSLEAVGFADIAARKLMTADALFWIASQTKPMTSTALMMLVEEGLLTLDDPVEKFLPEFKGQMAIAEKDDEHVLLKKPSHPITVREILSHTSGLPFTSAIESPTLDMLPLQTTVRSHAMSPLQTEPGTKYEYSNAGTNTAGRIIEVLSGMPYDDFMRTRLFEPLGMNETSFVPTDEQVARLAKTYKPDAAKTRLEETRTWQLFYPLTDPRRQPMPAGGLFSTARDVLRFCQMILNGGELDGRRYVSADSIKQMTTKQTGSKVENCYGLAWGLDTEKFGHGGALSTNMSINPGRGIITIFLVQHEGWPNEAGKCQELFNQAVIDWVDKRPVI